MVKKETRKILITGAVGQIGSELTPALRKKYGNDNVVACGRKTKPSDKLLNSGPFEYMDITDKDSVEKVVKKYIYNTHLSRINLGFNILSSWSDRSSAFIRNCYLSEFRRVYRDNKSYIRDHRFIQLLPVRR